MSDKKQSTRSTGKRSHAEIRKSRGDQPVNGSAKVAARLQRKIDRLRKMGVIASGFLPKDVSPLNVTHRQLKEAEEKFKTNLAKYDNF